MTGPGTDRDVAVRAAMAGAAVLRRMYGSELTRQAKSATDVATAATTVAAVAHPPSGEVYWADHGAFGILGREHGAPANTLVDINADGPLDRPFVGAQLAADPAFRAAFAPRVESTTLALAWVAAGRRLAYVSDGRLDGSVHFAAGIALCEAAPGCIVTDFDGAPVHTGVGLVAAADAGAHATLLDLVARHRSS